MKSGLPSRLMGCLGPFLVLASEPVVVVGAKLLAPSAGYTTENAGSHPSFIHIRALPFFFLPLRCLLFFLPPSASLSPVVAASGTPTDCSTPLPLRSTPIAPPTAERLQTSGQSKTEPIANYWLYLPPSNFSLGGGVSAISGPSPSPRWALDGPHTQTLHCGCLRAWVWSRGGWKNHSRVHVLIAGFKLYGQASPGPPYKPRD